jgi:nitroreductase
LVLATAWLSLAIGLGMDFTVAEPFAAFKFQAAPASVLVLAGVFAVLSLFVPRAWCRFLCPTGQLLSIARCQKSPEGSALVRFETLVICLLLVAAGWFAWTTAYVPEEQPNDVLSVIHSRRSVRTYTDEPVTETQLDTLLRAGMAAPTAGNAQPWSFVVVTDRAQLQSLADGLEYGRMLTKAGAAIVVCGLPEEALPGAARDMWVLDCTAASENILLAAEGIGLGAVWVGVYPIEERVQHVRKALGLPASVVPLNVISIGHPTGVERAKNKYDPDRVRWQSWESEEP